MYLKDTWSTIHIQSNKASKISQLLISKLEAPPKITEGEFPKDFDKFSNPMDEPPNYLVLGKTHQDWITIHHNSFSKIENWGVELSKVFHTKLLIIHYSWNSIFYFAAYDRDIQK